MKSAGGRVLHPVCTVSIILISFMSVFLPAGLYSLTESDSLAVLPFENMSGNPDQDYLKGIISSVLVEDLSESRALVVVERDILETVIKEQKLQFSGLIDDKGAIKAGRLLGASFILKGSYVFLGQDIFINITLIDVETGRSVSFSERGYQENTVHSLSEKLLKHMTGKYYSLQKPSGERTILALDQQEPGTVKLFSRITNARIFVDGEFAGKTTGILTTPIILKMPPGNHTLRIHLNRDFGVLHLPEVTFDDWQKKFSILPGDTIVLEDQTRHFNELLRDLRQLLRESIELKIGSGEQKQISHSINFTDREGAEVEMELSVIFKEINFPRHGGSAEVSFNYQGKDYIYEYFVPDGKNLEFTENIGKIRLDSGLDCNSSYRYELNCSIRRTDVWAGMYKE